MLLSLPLVFALVAYFLNKGEREKEIKNILDKIQQYNLNILVAFISAKKLEGVNADYLKSELIKHNWDPLLVSIALEKVFRQ
jgi:ribonuclease HII